MIYEFEKFYDDIIAEFKSAGVVVMFKVFSYFRKVYLLLLFSFFKFSNLVSASFDRLFAGGKKR